MELIKKTRTIINVFKRGAVFERLFKITFSKSDIIWKWMNKESKLKKNSLEALKNEFLSKIVQEIRIEGFCKISLENILTEIQTSELNDYVKDIYKKVPRNRKNDKNWSSPKEYIDFFEGGFFPKESQQYDINSPLHNLAINENILEVVNNYFDSIGRLCYIELNRCNVVDDECNASGSQKIHRDPALRHTLKVFIYWDDVSENGGAFTYFPKTHLYGKDNNYAKNNKILGGSFYPDASEFQGKKELKLTGKKGTLIFCDTAGFHYGGRTLDIPRKMSTFVYYPEVDIVKSCIEVSDSYSKFSTRQSYCLGIDKK